MHCVVDLVMWLDYVNGNVDTYIHAIDGIHGGFMV